MLVKSYAKINVVLNVTGRRDDGMHTLDMVMLPLELHDSLLFSRLRNKENYVTFEDFSLGGNENNLVTKALKALDSYTELKDGFRVLINKNIPISAGLGGGSSNCAATLCGVNKLAKIGLSNQELQEIGFKLGSDVPFFVESVPARVTGVGDVVEPIKVKNDYYCLLVKPSQGLSTCDVYKACDEFQLNTYNVEDVIKALETGDDVLLAKSIGNSLEDVSIHLLPKVREIKEEIKSLGFDIVLMSGSGSCVFALSTDKKAIKSAFNHFFEKYPDYVVEMTKVRKGDK